MSSWCEPAKLCSKGPHAVGIEQWRFNPVEKLIEQLITWRFDITDGFDEA
jgi:hypothetical protein